MNTLENAALLEPIDLDDLGDIFSGADFVLQTALLSNMSYESAIHWRYFKDVLRRFDIFFGHETYFGLDQGLTMCLNAPIAEVVAVIGGR